MEKYKIIEVKESVFADNDREAARVRAALEEKGTFLLNLMSSPGSGKTTTLLRTIERLRGELRMGVMEADIDSDVDARTISGDGREVHPAAHGRHVPPRRGHDRAGAAQRSGRTSWISSCSKTSAISFARRSSTPVR